MSEHPKRSRRSIKRTEARQTRRQAKNELRRLVLGRNGNGYAALTLTRADVIRRTRRQ